MPETFPEAGSAWRRDGRLEEARAALTRAQEGARRHPFHEGGWEWPGLRGGHLGKRSWSGHRAAGACLKNKTEGENGGGDMGSHCENGLADEREMGGEVLVDEVAR